MIVSHSKVETFESCPYRYDLRYNQGIKTIPPDNADNALFLGTALHTGLEKDVQTAIHEYFMSYPVISDAQVNEAMKLEVMIPKAAAMIPPGEHEVKIEDDDFIGFIDLLAPAKTEQKLGGEHQVIPNVYDLYDFKYSNNVSKYKDSPQLHLYKYFFERTIQEKSSGICISCLFQRSISNSQRKKTYSSSDKDCRKNWTGKNHNWFK